MSMRETLNSQLLLGTVSGATFVPGNNAKDLNPLGYFLPKLVRTDPVAGGNIGNIASSTYDWWRAKSATLGSTGTQTGNAFALNVSTYAGMIVAMKRLYNHCSRGSGGSPDIAVFDQGSYEIFENAMDVKVRYTNTKMADVGFDNVKLRGATCIWDEVTPDVDSGTAAITGGTVFMLNSDFYHLVIDSETDMVTTPFVTPENQTASTAKILFMGNAAVSNLRKHGVGMEILQTIVA